MLEKFHQQKLRTQAQIAVYYLSTFILLGVITLSAAILVDYTLELGLCL